jgi:hypothetical protein
MRKVMVFVGLMLGAVCGAFGQCGGTQRWAVKDGTDDSAGQVDFTNIQDKTIADLMGILQAVLPGRGDNTTRVLPDETNVVRVQARLVQWKAEAAGDSDYHLVLTDDTLDFTQGKGEATGHGLVGEIPDPGCLSGAHGDFGTDSPFLTIGDGTMGITVARQQLESAFPNADLNGGWNDAGGARVEVVGVTFFDPAHGQTGRAPNGLEIHPIVSIKFLDNADPMTMAMGKPSARKPSTVRHPHPSGKPSAKPSTTPLSIQDPDTGETATITEDHALVVEASENSGKSGALKAGVKSADLGFPKTLTVCWFAGTGTAHGVIQISLDGKSWFDVEATAGKGCKAVPPARYVKLTANKGMYQASY